MIIGMLVMVPMIHRVFPVEPDEVGGERTEGEIEPEGVIEAEVVSSARMLGLGSGTRPAAVKATSMMSPASTMVT